MVQIIGVILVLCIGVLGIVWLIWFASVLEGDVMSKGSTATKRDPKKWAAAGARAKAKMGGKHSARAMQLAVKYYKDSGGTYSGKKKSSNKLSKWSKQKWRTKSGKNSTIVLRQRVNAICLEGD